MLQAALSITAKLLRLIASDYDWNLRKHSAFVGSNCNKLIIMQGMKNVKMIAKFQETFFNFKQKTFNSCYFELTNS